jgi:hypothetical protein
MSTRPTAAPLIVPLKAAAFASIDACNPLKNRSLSPPKADIALAHWDVCLVKADVRLPCGLHNHTAVGLFPSVAGPSPRVIAFADVAGHVARAGALPELAFAHDAGLNHLAIVFDVLGILGFAHIIDPEDERHLRSDDVSHAAGLPFQSHGGWLIRTVALVLLGLVMTPPQRHSQRKRASFANKLMARAALIASFLLAPCR